MQFSDVGQSLDSFQYSRCSGLQNQRFQRVDATQGRDIVHIASLDTQFLEFTSLWQYFQEAIKEILVDRGEISAIEVQGFERMEGFFDSTAGQIREFFEMQMLQLWKIFTRQCATDV